MKDLRRIFLIVLFALGAITINAQENSAAINAYNEALELVQSKDYDAAISKYREAISIAEGLGAEGEDIKNRSQKAIPQVYFQKAVDSYNTFKSSPSIENLDAAISQFSEARAIAVDFGDDQIRDKSRSVLAQLHYQKGTMLFKRENFVESEASFDKAIEVNPNYAKAYYQKALVHKKNKPDDLEGILNWFDRAIAVGEQVNDGTVVRLANESAHAELLFRGSKLIEQGQNTRAIELLQMSLEYDNTSADSYYRLAEASNKLGNRDNAIRYANQALTYESGGNTDKAKIYYELGLAYQAKNDKGSACDAFANASYGSFKALAEHKMEFELKCESAR